MFVNNIDISNFNATLLHKEINPSEVVIFDDWLRNSLNPLYLGKKEKYKQIKLILFIDDESEENALNDISNIIKQLEKCTLKFDDLTYYYDSLIVNNSQERKAIGKYLLNVDLKSGFSYKAEIVETASRIGAKTINVPGNEETPAIVEITPSIDIIDITVTGLGDSFTIKNLKVGLKVIIDGEAGTVLQGSINKFTDWYGWEFPKLEPGANTITFSQINCDITIKYKPRWI